MDLGADGKGYTDYDQIIDKLTMRVGIEFLLFMMLYKWVFL